jgi:peptide/nickel transport system permease protein
MGDEPVAPSPHEEMRRRARSHTGLIIGSAVILITTLVAVFAPVLAPYDPYDQDLAKRLVDPVWTTGDWSHVLGTDALGRDYLSRLIFGARISLMVGFGAALIAGTIGSIIGIVGAGGIGLHLSEQIRTLEWQRVAFIVLMILIIVSVIDYVSSILRAAITGAKPV